MKPFLHATTGAVLLALVTAGPLAAQSSSGATVLRSESVVSWWTVDDATGRAAFIGGDILAICDGRPDGWDLFDFREVTDPREVATMLQARGDAARVTVWERAPRMMWPAMCDDVRAQGAPWAQGTARLNVSGRFPVSWGDPDVTSQFGLVAQGTVETADGRSMRLQASYRCTPADETECRQRLEIR